MPFWYNVRRAAAAIGGLIFLFAGFGTFVMGDRLIDSIRIVLTSEGAPVVYLAAATIAGGMAFVWGMGWTMSNKERKKMQKHRELEKEKQKKQKELEHKRRRLLRKHGLEPK